MQHNNEILEELRLIAPVLAGEEKLYAFQVPRGYFDALGGQMKAEFLVPFNIKTPFVIPAGYFETLAEKILSQIEIPVDEELAAIAPLLNTLEKKTMYQTPTGYFDQPVAVPAQEKTGAKVVSFKGYKRWMQYAAAAMLGGVLVSGAFLFTDSKDYIRADKEGALNTTQQSHSVLTEEARNGSVRGIVPSVKHPVIAKKAEMLSDDELQNYLDENVPSEQAQVNEESLDGTIGI
jgi:hypothetical protein